MAKQLFVKLQTPSVEIRVESRPDASGEVALILVGFKRYPTDKIEGIIEQFKTAAESEEAALEFLAGQMIYIKGASLDVYEEDTFSETLIIEDTRTAKPFEPFWETGKEALAVLSSYYLNSAPWKAQLTDAFMKALVNIDFKDAEVKN